MIGRRLFGALSVFAAGVAAAFLILPIVALVVRALQQRAWTALPDSPIPDALVLSAVTTAATLILTLIFGTPLAFALGRRRFPFKRIVNAAVELPILMPPAVAGLALLIAFGRRGVIGAALDDAGIRLAFTTAAVIMAQTFVAAPFYIRAASVGFASVPREIEDAGRVDGADGAALFWYVTLPLSARAMSAGLIQCWARALGEFGATILFAGSLQGRTQTMPLLIYNLIERDIDAAIWTGVLLIALALAALLAAGTLRRAGDGL